MHTKVNEVLILPIMIQALLWKQFLSLSWLFMSDADVAEMEIEVERSCQNSVIFCCCAVWKNGVWHQNVYEENVCNWTIESWTTPCWKKMAFTEIYLHLLNVYGDQTVDVSTVRWWVLCFSSGVSDSESVLLVQIFMNMACRILFTTDENA